MRKYSKFIILAILCVGFLSSGCYKRMFGVPRGGESTTIYQKAKTNLEPAQTVIYEGEEGKTALQGLKDKYTVRTKEYSGLGEFVESISGISPDSKHFWAFYVNGSLSNVGPSFYNMKKSDKIEWKLEEIK
jgi:hypothetical protein